MTGARLSRSRRTLIAGVAASGLCVAQLAFVVGSPASAAPTVLHINATYAAGGTLIGTIAFDAAACAASVTAPECPDAYTDWNLTSSAGGIYGATTYTPANSEVASTSSASAVAIGKPQMISPTTALNLSFNPSLQSSGTHSLAPFEIPPDMFTSLELHPQYLSETPPTNAYRLISAGTVGPASPGALRVKALRATKLRSGKQTTVIRTARVRPASAGKVASIRVRCSDVRSLRGDVNLCTAKKNLRTGRVAVTPLGGRGSTVKVTITTKRRSGSTYEPQVWSRTWVVK